MSSLVKVSIIIVNWNVRDLLRKNILRLASLRREDFLFEVFVVDNGSHDDSARVIREEFPWVNVLQYDYNAGFAKACNQALRVAQGEVMVLLNPDACVDEGTLERTYAELLEHKDIGVLGVRLLDEQGNVVPSVRRDPHLLDQLVIFLKLPHLFPSLNSRYLAKDIKLECSQDVEQVRGSYFAFRRQLLDTVGFLDERFFLWFEEVDFCKRVRASGLRVHYCAEVTCRDFVGRSFAQVPLWRKQGIFFSSMMKYFVKWRLH